MVFAVDSNGVPSMAKIVKLGGAPDTTAPGHRRGTRRGRSDPGRPSPGPATRRQTPRSSTARRLLRHDHDSRPRPGDDPRPAGHRPRARDDLPLPGEEQGRGGQPRRVRRTRRSPPWRRQRAADGRRDRALGGRHGLRHRPRPPRPVTTSASSASSSGWTAHAVGAEDTTTPYAGGGAPGVANGPHSITAVARDAAAERHTRAPSSVTVSNAVATGPGRGVRVQRGLRRSWWTARATATTAPSSSRPGPPPASTARR